MRETVATLSQRGRIVIPASYRRALGIEAGDEVVLVLEDDEVRVMTLQIPIKHAQAVVGRYVPEGRSLVQELTEERNAESRRG